MSLLAIAVTALTVYTSITNRNLIEGLVAGDPSSFATFADRQDAYIFLQSEEPGTRLKVAAQLGEWKSSRAAKLAILLIPDPDPAVRSKLGGSLAGIARRDAESVAAEFGAAGAAESAALVEAAAFDPETGIQILDHVLRSHPESANAYLLAKRIGSASVLPVLTVLEKGSDAAALLGADVLSSLELNPALSVTAADCVLARYRASKAGSFRDKLLPHLAHFAPKGGADIFRSTALDETAPTVLRVAATKALRAQGDPLAGHMALDPDTAVASAAAGQ